jgi:hypothetical protein
MVLTGVCLTLNAASMDDLQAQKHLVHPHECILMMGVVLVQLAEEMETPKELHVVLLLCMLTA